MEQLLTAFVQDVRGIYGEDLLAVFLYGSAAAGEHVPGRSDVNVVVILRKLTPADLRRAAGHLKSWHRRGFATPLFFDPEILRDSLDVFPIEFLDMQERHRTLWGADLLANLVIARGNLRMQCEQELRGKLMKLRQCYVESSHAPGEMERILTASASSIAVLARTLLRLGGGDPAGGAEGVLERAEARFGVGTASLRKAWQLKRGAIRLTGSSLEELYQEVLQEVQGLVQVVDGLAA